MRQIGFLLTIASLLLAIPGCNSRQQANSLPNAANESVIVAPTTAPAPIAHSSASYDHDVRDSVVMLASKEMEGRGIGTRGIDLAADHIARSFNSIGLQHAPGMSGYFQSFTMRVSSEIDANTKLRLGSEAFVQGLHFTPISFSASGSFDAPVAFVGYGISSQQHQYDDYAGMDVNGRIAMAMRFEPHDAQGKSRFTGGRWSEAAALYSKAKTAAAKGAVALLVVTPPKHHEEDDGLTRFGRQFDGMLSKIPVVQITPDTANRLMATANTDLAALQQKIDESGKPASVALDQAKLSGNVTIKHVEKDVKNVVAMLPGSGPRRDEFIIVGAHYDHLGKGGRYSLLPTSTAIHPGADDNASGTAALIEVAERLKSAGRLDRSVIFVAFTAEETGLQGSQFFVENPPVPIARMIAMINLDMVGRVRDNTIYIGGGGTAEAFEEVIAKASSHASLAVRNMGSGGFGPSDNTSFAMKHVPVLLLFTGTHGDYHRPTDTAEKINYEGIAKAIQLTTSLIEQIDDLPRQQYVAAHDSHHMGIPGITTGGSPSGSRVLFGIMPDYAMDEVKGARVSGVTTGTPADQAGVQAQDVIVRFADEEIENIYDLTRELAKAKPGQTVNITLRRGQNTIETKATLVERK